MGYQPKVTPEGEQNPPQGVSAIIPYGQASGDAALSIPEQWNQELRNHMMRPNIMPLPEYEEMLVPYPELDAAKGS